MVLANFIAFTVLKILHNLIFMKKSLFEITAEVGKVTKSVPCDLTFIFIELSEIPNSFVKIRPA